MQQEQKEARQKNSVDCGPHVCHYLAQAVTNDWSIAMFDEHMPAWREAIYSVLQHYVHHDLTAVNAENDLEVEEVTYT